MKLIATVTVLGLATLGFSYTNTYMVSYDSLFDDGQNSLSEVTCAHGEHGLLTHGYTTFDSLPTFPYIGGAPQIQGPDSRYCGTCWELTYTDNEGIPTCLNFTAIEMGKHDTFTTSMDGLDVLTQGEGKKHKSFPITAVRKPASWCGL